MKNYDDSNNNGGQKPVDEASRFSPFCFAIVQLWTSIMATHMEIFKIFVGFICILHFQDQSKKCHNVKNKVKMSRIKSRFLYMLTITQMFKF